jgi:protein-disulfide isomerase
MDRHPTDVAVVFRHFPLDSHESALPTAIAAECAAAQGQFAKFAEVAFQNQASLSTIGLDTIAVMAGIPDTAHYRFCRDAIETRSPIDRDIRAGTELGIAGTPALIIGREMVYGAVPLDTLEALVAAQLRAGSK